MAFLLDLPGPHNIWSSVEWGEAMSLILALPSNSCKEFLGQKIGDRVVDKWGAELLCAKVPGGSFIRRHNRIKSCISSLTTYCGMDFINERLIADIKTISLGTKSLYKPGGRAMDIRASRIQGEYRLLARKVDLELRHPGGQGPTTRKLSQFPPVLDLCFGAYGETSEGVKSLLDMLVDARVRRLGLPEGHQR